MPNIPAAYHLNSEVTRPRGRGRGRMILNPEDTPRPAGEQASWIMATQRAIQLWTRIQTELENW